MRRIRKIAANQSLIVRNGAQSRKRHPDTGPCMAGNTSTILGGEGSVVKGAQEMMFATSSSTSKTSIRWCGGSRIIHGASPAETFSIGHGHYTMISKNPATFGSLEFLVLPV